jgi:hypothetical protein
MVNIQIQRPHDLPKNRYEKTIKGGTTGDDAGVCFYGGGSYEPEEIGDTPYGITVEKRNRTNSFLPSLVAVIQRGILALLQSVSCLRLLHYLRYRSLITL